MHFVFILRIPCDIVMYQWVNKWAWLPLTADYRTSQHQICQYRNLFSPLWSQVRWRNGQITVVTYLKTLRWRHNERGGVSNHRRLDCWLNLLRRGWKKTSKLCVTGHFEGNPTSPVDSPHKRASIAENVSIRLGRHDICLKDSSDQQIR